MPSTETVYNLKKKKTLTTHLTTSYNLNSITNDISETGSKAAIVSCAIPTVRNNVSKL